MQASQFFCFNNRILGVHEDLASAIYLSLPVASTAARSKEMIMSVVVVYSLFVVAPIVCRGLYWVLV